MKNNKLIIFGDGEQAEMAYYYFQHDSEYEVVAFTVDREYLEKNTLLGLDIVSFEEITTHYPPSQFQLFIAIGYNKINKLRALKFNDGKNKGYKLASYISSKASIFIDNFGENCFILEDNTIQPYVEIGNNVTIWSGNHIGHHSIIEDNCFITSHVVVSGGCLLGNSTFIGVNATIRDHVNIGKSNVIGAGALILSSTKDNSVYMEKATEVSNVPSNRLFRI